MSRDSKRLWTTVLWVTGLLLTAVSGAQAGLVLGEARALWTDPSRAEKPAISPDGAKLAFISDKGGAENVWTTDFDGGQPVQLTHETRANVQCANPHWSPKGDFVVYSSNKGTSGGYDLWLVSADGRSDAPLTNDAALDWMPSWSPDGKQIAFVSDREQTDALWLINVDGSGLKKLADLTYEPCWSPDGRQLAAYHVEGQADGIYVFDAATPKAPKLVLAGGRMPAWSSDGRWLVAVKADSGGERLWLIDLQRDTAAPLGPATEGMAWPTWGSRGPSLAWEAKSGGRKQVFIAGVVESRPVAALLDPVAGAAVRGAVAVKAKVGGEGSKITSWRLEYGQGVGPRSWSLIAEGSGGVDGELTVWKTGGLEGVYTLRLTAITDTGETSVSALPVTVFGQYGVVWDKTTIPSTMSVNGLYNAEVRLRNIGTMTWRNDGQFAVYGSYQWVDSNGRVVVAEGLRSDLPRDVSAEESVVLPVTVAAPATGGTYTLRFDLRQGGQVWFAEQGAQPLELTVNVTVPFAFSIDAPSPPTVMVPGQIYTVELRLANRGASPWQGLGGSPTPGPTTVQVTCRWKDLEGGLVETMSLLNPLPNGVAPGEQVALLARVQAPSVNGRYRLMFDLRDDKGLFSERMGAEPNGVNVTVSSPYQVTFGDHNTPGRMFPGDLQMVNLQARNAGSLKWRSDGPSPVKLSYSWVDRTGKPTTASPIQTDLPYDVLPGMTVALAARVQAPGEPGEYTLVWDFTQSGGRRFAELGNVPLKVSVMVGAPTHNVRWEQLQHPVQMVVGTLYTVELRLTNAGAMSWTAQGKDAVKLGYHWVRPSGEELAKAPLFTDLPESVDPTRGVRVTARVQAPDRAGRYMLKWDLYQGGYDFFSTRGAPTLDIPVSVEVIYGAQYLSHDTPTRLVAGQKYRVNLRIKNSGTIPWEAGGTVPVVLSYRWYNAAGDEAQGTQQLRTALTRTVQPGDSLELAATLEAPIQAGKYDLEWDLLFASAFWFSEKGVTPLRVPVLVE